MRRGSKMWLAGVAALALSAAVPAAAAGQSDQPGQVSSRSPFAAGCNGAEQSGTVFRNSEIEPYVSVNPKDPDNLIAVYMQDRWSNGGANGLLTSVSRDGGATWKQLPLSDQPAFSHCTLGNASSGGDFERAADPWISFGPDGKAYQAGIGFNRSNTDRGTMVSTSTNGGRTWAKPSMLKQESDPNVSNERAAITADPTTAGTAYVEWDRIVRSPRQEYGGPTVFTRTTDGGRTWEPVREIYPSRPGYQTSGNQITVMPNGDLVNVFDEFEVDTQNVWPRRDRVMVIRSEDQGKTWSKPTPITRTLTAGVTDPRDGARVRTGDIFTDICADKRPGSNTLYAAWEDARFTSGPGRHNQIAFARSTDGGRTWSDPERVSSDIDTQAFVPSLDVAADGSLAVTYYDFSADSTDTQSLDTQMWSTRSHDGGKTWEPRKQLTTQPFDMRLAPNAGGYFMGEYQGLESAGNTFKVVATRADTPDNPTDLFSRTVR
ncbi:sialidase family protein [Streptomyces sp. NPDC046821]|uniref:sialidase family protein n=1 Tax=Streptomyces sp. NPDC046821 TaxID=3154702 RepID=UPI0033EE4332